MLEKSGAKTQAEAKLAHALQNSGDVTQALKELYAANKDPKDIASYLYRLERAGNVRLAEKLSQENNKYPELKKQVVGVATDRLEDTNLTKVQQNTIKAMLSRLPT